MSGHDVIGLFLEAAILYFVAMEYLESKNLNALLAKKYKSRKKVSADKIIKEVLKEGAQ